MTTNRFGLPFIVAWVFAFPCVVQATDPGPAPSAQGATLALQGNGPYFLLQVPMALRSRSASSDMSDLQVVNARGEALPFAWAEARAGTTQQHELAVPVFKLPGAASGTKALPSRSWMLDAREVRGSFLWLDLGLPDTARGVYTLAVETSHDLQQWRTVQPSVQVLSLDHEGQRLASTRIDLAGTRAGYLRLSALPRSLLPELRSARITSVSEEAAAQPMQWSEPIAASSCGPQHCDYALPAHVPLEQVQLQLAEPNTLANVQLLVEEGSTPAHEHRRHALRHPLKALRHKSEASNAASLTPNRVVLSQAGIYWLRLPEGEVRSGPLWLNAGFHSSLRVQTRGPIQQLGPTPPLLRVGARAATLVFLAQGPGPYRMVWGAPPTRAALPLAQLMPMRKDADALPQDTASLLLATPNVAASAVRASAPASAAASSPRSQPVWLWGVLLAGLAAMGFMAWSLLGKSSAQARA